VSRALTIVPPVLLALAGCSRVPTDPVERATMALTDEFADAYPTDVRERGRVHAYEPRPPRRLPLLDGRPLAVWAYDGQVPGRSSAPSSASVCASASPTGCRSTRPSTGTACACRTQWTDRRA
jgi:hypothetical protein